MRTYAYKQFYALMHINSSMRLCIVQITCITNKSELQNYNNTETGSLINKAD